MNRLAITFIFFVVLFASCSHTRKAADNTPVFKEHKDIRLKLTVTEGFSNESDKFTQNDQFAAVVYKGNLILTTNVIQDNNSCHWQNQSVIFDYNTDSLVTISQLDDDYSYHDLLSQYTGKLKPGELRITGTASYLIVKIEESKEEPTTTGVEIPTNTNLSLFLQTVKAEKVISAKQDLKGK